jgi:hypothetical protein
MKIEKLDDVIATRTLFVASDELPKTEVFVRIGRPQQFPDSLDYFCPFEISGVGDDKLAYAAGVDGVQAIQEAMRLIGMELYLKINPRIDGRLRWKGDDSGVLGFPRFPE